MPIDKALSIASKGGARVLGRDDVGVLEVGKGADIAIFNTNDIGQSGADDMISSLLLCQPVKVDTLIINGKIQIEDGHFINQDINLLMERHSRKSKDILSTN